MTRRIPAAEEARLLACLGRCTRCAVLTYPDTWPADLRPAFGKPLGGCGLCLACYSRDRRAGRVIARRRPCARCGVTRSVCNRVTSELCADCIEVAHPTAGDIGRPVREIELEPIESPGVPEPAQPAVAPEREPVPA